MEKKHELAAGPSIQGDGIAETTTAIEVFSGPGMSINLRFCLMKEVAAYKAQQGQAFADPEQERDVLERAFAVRAGKRERQVFHSTADGHCQGYPAFPLCRLAHGRRHTEDTDAALCGESKNCPCR